MAQYQGHKNWNHWNVSLWINNDEALYNSAKYYVYDSKQSRAGMDSAAEKMLESLHGAGVTRTPDGAPYSVTTIRAAMKGM